MKNEKPPGEGNIDELARRREEIKAVMLAKAKEIENVLKREKAIKEYLEERNYRDVTEIPSGIIEGIERQLSELVKESKGNSITTAKSLLVRAGSDIGMWVVDPLFYLALARALRRSAETI